MGAFYNRSEMILPFTFNSHYTFVPSGGLGSPLSPALIIFCKGLCLSVSVLSYLILSCLFFVPLLLYSVQDVFFFLIGHDVNIQNWFCFENMIFSCSAKVASSCRGRICLGFVMAKLFRNLHRNYVVG